MPTVAVVFGMTIMFFYNDHEPPHFHVQSSEFSAKIGLSDLGLMEVQGTLRNRDIRRLRAWALANHLQLWENWLLARRKLPLVRIGS